MLAGALRLASVVLCLIVIASFALFAINQTGNASAHQQEVLNGNTTTTTDGSTPRAHATEGSVHKTIDEAADAVTSPFSAATDATNSRWLIHAINLLLTLLVYGFGLAFLARVIRVRL
jgi:hypothetical protein